MVKILSSKVGLALVGVLVLALLAIFVSTAPSPQVAGITTSVAKRPTRTVYVSVAGTDTLDRGSALNPWRTIGFALQQATPGTVIRVAAGEYAEHITTAHSGTATAPILLQGVGRVVLTGAEGEGRIMEILHDYYRVEGFEFTGRDIQLWLQEADHATIARNYFHDAAGECVRIKYQSSNNVFERNRVEYCGREDFSGSGGGKNGEGVYIGTAPEQLGKNPTADVDHSNNNVVRHNMFATHGNECVDIKEGSEKNIVEFNNCTSQQDPDSGGMDSRGNHNIFRYNRIYGNKGAGIRFGGDTAADGLFNEAYGNIIQDNDREALKVLRSEQSHICGNTTVGNKRGVSNRAEIENAACAWPLLPAGSAS